jgi:hypothetical protein
MHLTLPWLAVPLLAVQQVKAWIGPLPVASSQKQNPCYVLQLRCLERQMVKFLRCYRWGGGHSLGVACVTLQSLKHTNLVGSINIVSPGLTLAYVSGGILVKQLALPRAQRYSPLIQGASAQILLFFLKTLPRLNLQARFLGVLSLSSSY